MKKIISWSVGIGVFIGWMNLVGSPSEKETVIGLFIAFLAGFFTCKFLNCSPAIKD